MIEFVVLWVRYNYLEFEIIISWLKVDVKLVAVY